MVDSNTVAIVALCVKVPCCLVIYWLDLVTVDICTNANVQEPQPEVDEQVSRCLNENIRIHDH